MTTCVPSPFCPLAGSLRLRTLFCAEESNQPYLLTFLFYFLHRHKSQLHLQIFINFTFIVFSLLPLHHSVNLFCFFVSLLQSKFIFVKPRDKNVQTCRKIIYFTISSRIFIQFFHRLGRFFYYLCNVFTNFQHQTNKTPPLLA